MRHRFAAILVAITFGIASMAARVAGAQSGRPLTDQDVIEMSRAGFGDSTILKYIQANDVDFDLSVPAMVILKSAGVSQSLIEAMLAVAIEKKTGGAAAILEEIARRSTGLPDEVGFYAHQNGKLMAIAPEIVNWHPGGMMRNIAAVGTSPISGTVSGSHSQLAAIWPPLNMVPLAIDFYILCPEGSAASDFQLLRLSSKSEHRELRAVAGGVASSVPFSFGKVAPKTYKITLPNLSVGEYGFLLYQPDVTTNSPATSRIYTFRIVE